jgi:hypothetical protein
MSVDARVLNDLFSSKLDDPEERSKIAAAGGQYIRDRLREVSFARKILPPKQVTKADCQKSVNHDTLIKIEEMEPQSRAMAVTFRGEATSRYVSAARFEIPFYTIESEHFEKTEQELLAYDYPITKVIEDNTVTDIQEIEDMQFLLHAENCVQLMQREAQTSQTVTGLSAKSLDAGTVVEDRVLKGELARARVDANGDLLDDWAVQPVQRPDFINLFKVLVGGANGAGNGRLRMEVMLMTEWDFNDILQWTIEDFGDKVTSETVVNGYKYNLLLGKRFVRTIKVDILRTGNIYGFTSPDFLGRFYILNNTKFYIDKRGRRIEWWCWEDIGMAFGNIAAIAKMELYSASVTEAVDTSDVLQSRKGALSAEDGDEANDWTDAAVSGLTSANKLPVGEDALGAVNHKLEDGLSLPLVDQF